MSALLVLLVPRAWAFAPTDTVWTGIEPQRVMPQHAAEQGRLLRSEAWQTFAQTDGKGWTARFDEATATPRWMWGAGIPMPENEDALVAELTALLERHTDLLGFEQGTLSLASARYVPRVSTWYVEFDVLRESLPTYRGGIGARIKHGNLVLLTVATAPTIEVTGTLTIDADRAIDRAITLGPAPAATHTDRSAVATLLEQKDLAGHVLRKAWQVESRTQSPPGRWVSFVDGETGALLSVHNEVRFVNGSVTAMHHLRAPDGSALVESPVPFAEVSSSNDAATADEDGIYTVNTGSPYSTDLDGDYLNVLNSAGGEGFLSESTADLTWTSSDATQAEIDSYVFIHQVKAWGEANAPEVSQVSQAQTAYVNINDVCNAYWDGDVNFFSSGSGCNNTGQIADVNYHEWGHGFHYHSLEAGYFDGSLSEGAGDVVSFLQTGDRYMAPDFFTDGGAIRDVGPDQEYPQDYVNSPDYVHSNGLIFGGALFDLLDLLVDAEGETVGNTSTSQIFAGLLKGGSDIPGSFYEALVADDDDGDLANGSPHVCELYDAFGRHGLGTATSDDVVLASHTPLVLEPSGAPHEVAVDLLQVAGGCTSVDADDAEVHYRVDGKGEWQTVGLSVVGSSVIGDIPAQPAGSIVEYYVTGTVDGGDDFATPSGMETNPYTFYVGDVIEVHCDDFEADDGGYLHELVQGTPGDGADDWQWGTPNGASGDPASAFSGQNAWGNDLGHDNFNGAYQAEKWNRIEGPPIETGHYTEVFLQYRRWLQVEDGTFDEAFVTANGDTVWSNWDSQNAPGDEHHLDGLWASHVVDLGGRADQGSVSIGFDLRSDGGLELGGWTIDDVCIVAPATANNRLGITDLVVTAKDDIHATLTWTNPIHRPVERVVVVRRTDRMPQGWQDGQLTIDLTAPALGEVVTVDDTNGFAGRTYYAVYASDGAEWLSWTEGGWNAAEVTLVGGLIPAGDLPGGDGGYGAGYRSMSCGCDGSGSATVPWFGVLASLAFVARRRSREGAW